MWGERTGAREERTLDLAQVKCKGCALDLEVHQGVRVHMASARTCVARVRSHWTRCVAAQMPGAAERGVGVLLTLKGVGGCAEKRRAALRCTGWRRDARGRSEVYPAELSGDARALVFSGLGPPGGQDAGSVSRRKCYEFSPPAQTPGFAPKFLQSLESRLKAPPLEPRKFGKFGPLFQARVPHLEKKHPPQG